MYRYLVFLLLICAVAANREKVQPELKVKIKVVDEFLAKCVGSEDLAYDTRFCDWALSIDWPKKIRDLPLMRCCELREMRVEKV